MLQDPNSIFFGQIMNDSRLCSDNSPTFSNENNPVPCTSVEWNCFWIPIKCPWCINTFIILLNEKKASSLCQLQYTTLSQAKHICYRSSSDQESFSGLQTLILPNAMPFSAIGKISEYMAPILQWARCGQNSTLLWSFLQN